MVGKMALQSVEMMVESLAGLKADLMAVLMVVEKVDSKVVLRALCLADHWAGCLAVWMAGYWAV